MVPLTLGAAVACQSRPIPPQKKEKGRKLVEASGLTVVPGPESNRHALRRGILSPLRLPISPPGRVICEDANYGTVSDHEYTKLSKMRLATRHWWRLQRIGAQENAARGNVVLGKLEGNNPAGSVKDRPALSMIRRAEERGEIQPGRYADRGHLGQHRHCAGHGCCHQGLPHGADDAGGFVD